AQKFFRERKNQNSFSPPEAPLQEPVCSRRSFVVLSVSRWEAFSKSVLRRSPSCGGILPSPSWPRSSRCEPGESLSRAEVPEAGDFEFCSFAAEMEAELSLAKPIESLLKRPASLS